MNLLSLMIIDVVSDLVLVKTVTEEEDVIDVNDASEAVRVVAAVRDKLVLELPHEIVHDLPDTFSSDLDVELIHPTHMRAQSTLVLSALDGLDHLADRIQDLENELESSL